MKSIYYHLEAPTSFDPLEADRAQNLPLMRMLYLTPIEVSVENDLVSTVLKSFDYNSNTKTISFVLNDKLQFEDGSIIDTEDVVLSIKRMLLKRPDFPVLKNVVGLSDWLKSEYPLLKNPSGIKTQGNEIKIELSSSVLNPLFRFTLELFSIIPKNCIDLKSNALKCEVPSFSGYYKLTYREKNTFVFERRLSPTAHKIEVSQHIQFNYINNKQLEEFYKIADKNSVLLSMDYFFTNSKLKEKFSKLKYRYLPYSYFFSLVLNPEIEPFNNISCRLAFANNFRNNLQELAAGKFNLSSSIFTPILPGYLEESAFLHVNKTFDCKMNPDLLKFFDPKDDSILSDVLALTYKQLNIPEEKIFKPSSILEAEKNFTAKQTPALIFGSGFWSLDPIGDLQMMFTPNLHPRLFYAATNSTINSKIDLLQNVESEEELTTQMKAFNLAIFESGLVNVFLHTRKFYASVSLENIRELPQQVAAPAPWQVFK